MIFPNNSTLALVMKLIAADRPMWTVTLLPERTRERRTPPKRRKS